MKYIKDNSGNILYEYEGSLVGFLSSPKNLENANLENANLTFAILENANLENASLQGANLMFVNLQGANLRNANLDLSTFPLWCGSFEMKVSSRLIYQLVAHIKRLQCDDEEVKSLLDALEPWKNEFCKHRNHIEPI